MPSKQSHNCSFQIHPAFALAAILDLLNTNELKGCKLCRSLGKKLQEPNLFYNPKLMTISVNIPLVRKLRIHLNGMISAWQHQANDGSFTYAFLMHPPIEQKRKKKNLLTLVKSKDGQTQKTDRP